MDHVQARVLQGLLHQITDPMGQIILNVEGILHVDAQVVVPHEITLPAVLLKDSTDRPGDFDNPLAFQFTVTQPIALEELELCSTTSPVEDVDLLRLVGKQVIDGINFPNHHDRLVHVGSQGVQLRQLIATCRQAIMKGCCPNDMGPFRTHVVTVDNLDDSIRRLIGSLKLFHGKPDKHMLLALICS